jgi:hypothetical protein
MNLAGTGQISSGVTARKWQKLIDFGSVAKAYENGRHRTNLKWTHYREAFPFSRGGVYMDLVDENGNLDMEAANNEETWRRV